ncbi:MAG: Smr/MutS family protein [Roseovarius sp.]
MAKTTERMHPAKPAKAKQDLPFREDKKSPDTPRREPIERFEIGQKANGKAARHDVLPGLPEQIAATPVQMDRKAYDRLKRGKLKPEGRIDLHGMTLDQAGPALQSFIMKSFARERRLVLVITGKGRRSPDDGPIPQRPGVLRHTVPHWLQSPPLSQMVLQITEAHIRHGGGGAYYVYLRRKR